jgi:flagellar hook-associated protein 1 FlgK
MSLRVALNAATSSLLAVQTQMSVTAQNIANADTDGYSRKTASLSATSSAGTGTGVTVNSISSSADANLIRSAMAAASKLGAASQVASYMDSLGSLMGTIDTDGTSGSSLTTALSDLQDALSALADTPESETLANQLVATLDDLTAQLRSTSSNVQNLRGQADSDIGAAVESVNSALHTIDDLNDQIVAAKARGQDTSDLEDQRTNALEAIASQMEVTYFTDSSGAMKIYTDGGTPLLTSTVHELSFDTAGSVNAAATYPGTLSGITVDGVDITSQIDSGTIGGLLQVRDEDLVAVQDELDQLASTLIDTLNAIYNTGTATPPPNSLTGTSAVTGTDALSASGTVRIALLESDGTVSGYTDFDLSSYATVDDMVAAIDAMTGVSASLDADGHLVISADDSSQGIGINEMDSAVGADGEGMSAYFGLNDLLKGSGASDISLSAALSADSSSLAIGTLSSSSSLAVGDIGIAEGDNSLVEALADALDDDASFDAAGNLSSSSLTFSSYAAAILSDVSSNVDAATANLSSAETRYSTLTNAIASVSGVNLDEETAIMSELENAYSIASTLLETLNNMFDDLLSAVR